MASDKTITREWERAATALPSTNVPWGERTRGGDDSDMAASPCHEAARRTATAASPSREGPMRSVKNSAQSDNADRLAASLPIVEMLSRPATYGRLPGERTQHVQCVETHISWVFLTDRFAYKLKKPVRFDFLDFSSPELRHEACQNEVRLNRRLAPSVYLAVEPVTLDRRDRPVLRGRGTAIDWVVKMRRLPEGRALDRLLAEGRATAAEIDSLAAALAAFYEKLPPLSIRADTFRREIEVHVEGNHRELLKAGDLLDDGPLAVLVRRVHAAQLRLLRLAPNLLDDRVCDGRIVEGHGDLRPEHIYLNPAPTIIDCIEFNPSFRQVDVLDELGFLAMECDRLGAADAGNRIVGRYLAASGDRAPAALLAFYKMYRACVRAKVTLLRAGQLCSGAYETAAAAARNYLALADGYAHGLGPPFVLVVFGLSGMGKSTLSDSLSDTLDVEVISSDAVRAQFSPSEDRKAGYGKGRYAEANRRRVYEEMFRRAESLLEQGSSVILDATFLAAEMRQEAVSLARRNEAQPLLIRCQCPDDVALERIATRTASGASLSEAGVEVFRRQKADMGGDLPDVETFTVDTTRSLPEQTTSAMEPVASLIPSQTVFELLSP